MDDYDGYNPQYDKYKETKVEDQEEGFLETLNRVAPDWPRYLLAVTLALPLLGLVIWVFETFIIK